MSTEWINVKDKLPKHQETVLVSSSKGFCVVVFIDSVKMNEELMLTTYAHECVDVSKHPYYFCSQEVKGCTLNGVTHWCNLDKPILYNPNN